jgi:hypothetical protein
LIDDGDLDENDKCFWTPLFELPLPAHLPQSKTQTFGQMAHVFLPNLMYILRFKSKSLRVPHRHPLRPQGPRIYISDQNVLEKRDVAAIHKIAHDISLEFYGQNAQWCPRSISREHYQGFEVGRLNRPDHSAAAVSIQQAIEWQVSNFPEYKDPDTQRSRRASFILPLQFMPYRNVALFDLGPDVVLRFDVLTTTLTPPNNLTAWMKRPLLDLFWLMRQTLTPDSGPSKLSRLALMLIADNRPMPELYARECSDIERVNRWIAEVSSLLLLPGLSEPDRLICQLAAFGLFVSEDPARRTPSPFDLFVQLPRPLSVSAFQETALDLHCLINTHHAQSAFDSKQTLPTFVELRGPSNYPEFGEQFFARMDFSSANSSKDLCVGHHHTFAPPSTQYRILHFYRDGVSNWNPQQEVELKNRFLAKWPAVAAYCHSRPVR